MKRFSILDTWVPQAAAGRDRRRTDADSPVNMLDACQLSDSIPSSLAGSFGCYLSRPY